MKSIQNAVVLFGAVVVLSSCSLLGGQANTNQADTTAETEQVVEQELMDEQANQTDPVKETTQLAEEQQDLEADGAGGVMNKSEQYLPYSEQAFAAASDMDRVIFFHASWCPTCRIANDDLNANSDQLPADAVVFKVDYDTATALKQEYGVTQQHTFVIVDAEGNEVAKWVNGSVEDITEQLEQV